MKVALYARVSSDKQDIDLSISAQVRALREYAAKNGNEVVREFIDEGLSGRTAARPAFREMIALAKAKQPPFEAISGLETEPVCPQPDRFYNLQSTAQG